MFICVCSFAAKCGLLTIIIKETVVLQYKGYLWDLFAPQALYSNFTAEGLKTASQRSLILLCKRPGSGCSPASHLKLVWVTISRRKAPASEGEQAGRGTNLRQPSRPFFLLVSMTVENAPMLICPETTPPKQSILVWRQHFIRFYYSIPLPSLGEPPCCSLLFWHRVSQSHRATHQP